MRNNVLRRLGLLLAVLMLLCLAPGSAQAMTRPNRGPYYTQITIQNTQGIISISVYVDGPDGSFYRLQTFERDYLKVLRFDRPEDSTRLYLEVTMEDGSVLVCSPVDTTTVSKIQNEHQKEYRYNVKANALEEINKLPLVIVSMLLLIPYMLIAFYPLLAVFAIAEVLICLLFKLKPVRYVIFVNLATILPIAIVLSGLFLFGITQVWIAALLQVIAAIVEYIFYRKKYTGHSNRKLLLYTILANAVSFTLFALVMG